MRSLHRRLPLLRPLFASFSVSTAKQIESLLCCYLRVSFDSLFLFLSWSVPSMFSSLCVAFSLYHFTCCCLLSPLSVSLSLSFCLYRYLPLSLVLSISLSMPVCLSLCPTTAFSPCRSVPDLSISVSQVSPSPSVSLLMLQAFESPGAFAGSGVGCIPWRRMPIPARGDPGDTTGSHQRRAAAIVPSDAPFRDTRDNGT